MPFTWKVLFEEITRKDKFTSFFVKHLHKVHKERRGTFYIPTLHAIHMEGSLWRIYGTNNFNMAFKIGESNLQMAEILDYLLNRGEYRRNTSRSILQPPTSWCIFLNPTRKIIRESTLLKLCYHEYNEYRQHNFEKRKRA